MFQPERLLGAVLKEAMGASLGGHRRTRLGHRNYGGGTNRALGMGLLGLAIGAYEHFVSQGSGAQVSAATTPPLRTPSAAPPPPPGNRPPPMPASAGLSPAVLAMRAMFSAAAADGAIDESEKQRILERVQKSAPSAEDESFLENELANPCSLSELLRQVDGAGLAPELKEQIYLAALVAVEVDNEQERAYFRDLAQGLGLTKTQTNALQQSIGIREAI